MQHFLHSYVRSAPLQWTALSESIADRMNAKSSRENGGRLYGIWRNQIGRPRDELTVITTWTEADHAKPGFERIVDGLPGAIRQSSLAMAPTLRPTDSDPPKRQGNFAFRWFETPAQHWDEFLELCASAWPGFESAYDSQVIGLWRITDENHDAEAPIRSLLLTRRPNLAMWERSKIPENEAEAEVRRKLSRRYDLCTDTVVFTTTLLTAEDRQDTARWT
jgi:hypothetical protein